MKRDVSALRETYPDSQWRQKYVAVCDLISMLRDCIIDDHYVVSDGLKDAIELSAAGIALRDRLTRKESVNARDAKLMCALILGHEELLIDIDKTDLDKLEDAVRNEHDTGRIRFPYILGRDFYHAFADTFEDERESLNVSQTQKLLDALPRGVFQYGNYTVGPLGLLKATTARFLHANLRVPSYHCGDPVCESLHPTYLETSS